MLNRRFLLQAMAAAGGVAATSGARAALAPNRNRAPIGIQLYTLLSLLEADFAPTLARVAATGYRDVETMGSFGRDPGQLREVLDRYGLRSHSQHVAPTDFYNHFRDFVLGRIARDDFIRIALPQTSTDGVERAVEKSIASAKALGQHYIVWPMIWPEQIASRQEIDRLCRAFNRAGDMCRREGLAFAFHNHDDEFRPRGDFIPYDALVDNTDPDTVKLELDLFWITQAGRDPRRYLLKYKDRYRLAHLKDRSKEGGSTALGKGVLDIKGFIRDGNLAGIRHFYFEGDNLPDSMAAAIASYDYLKDSMRGR